MATCACGRQFRWNWVRHPFCPICRRAGRVVPMINTEVKVINRGARVTVTFELPPDIDTTKFVGWLHTEVEMGNDYTNVPGEGMVGSVKIVDPVSVQVWGNPETGSGE